VEGPSSIVIADTSMLINFLAIGRMDLIKRHSCRFLITDHVRQEITEHYQAGCSGDREVMRSWAGQHLEYGALWTAWPAFSPRAVSSPYTRLTAYRF